MTDWAAFSFSHWSPTGEGAKRQTGGGLRSANMPFQ